MRIAFTQTGGIGYFPGLAQPITVDVDALAPAEGEELRRLVEAAHFFDLPAAVGTPAPGAADYQQYIVTVEEGARRHTVRALVPVEDAGLDALVRAVQKHVRAARAAGRGRRGPQGNQR